MVKRHLELATLGAGQLELVLQKTLGVGQLRMCFFSISTENRVEGPDGVIKPDQKDHFIQEIRGANNVTLCCLNISSMQLENNGQYTLIAENKHGKCCTSANISIITPPSPPAHFKCKWTRSHDKMDSLKLSWRASLKAGAQMLWYTVEYKKEGEYDTGFQPVIAGIQQCAIRISHLQPSIAYIFRVFAYNEALKSAPSALLRVVPVEEERLSSMQGSRSTANCDA
uniref:Fibronectin type-III domain-containing protein n=1 Tax=Ditylenchus dipsaci TaxID=166011 RepID=A0A915EBI6_9BILA